MRKEAVSEISRLTRDLPPAENAKELVTNCRKIEKGLLDGLASYRNEMASVRDRFWPKLIEAPESKLAAGGLAAVSLSLVGAPGGILLGSLVAAGLSLAKSGLDLRAARRKVERSTSPAIAYLTHLQDFR